MIKKRRSLLFFLCKHECSPSTSAVARRRFHDCEGGGDGSKESSVGGKGGVLKVNSVLETVASVGKVKTGRVGGEGGDEDGGIIPRRETSLAKWGQRPQRPGSTCSLWVCVECCESSGVRGGERTPRGLRKSEEGRVGRVWGACGRKKKCFGSGALGRGSRPWSCRERIYKLRYHHATTSGPLRHTLGLSVVEMTDVTGNARTAGE